MKPRHLTLCAVLLVNSCMTGCTQSTIIRPGPGGSKEVIKSYGLSERAGSFADAYARYRLRLPESPRQPVNSGGK